VTTVALEYRPALFKAFGIGRYVKNLAPALLDADPDLHLKLFSVFLRGHDARALAHDWPAARATRVSVRLPGRSVPWLGKLGYSFDRRLAPFDLFHHTDYAVTPLKTRRRVVTLYDTAWRGDLGWVEPAQSRRMERAVRGLLEGDPEIVTISEAARDDLVAYLRLDAARVHVTPLAADPIFSRRLPPGEIAQVHTRHGVRPPYVIALGTLEPRKNLLNLVQAMPFVERLEPELQLVLIGRPGHAHGGLLRQIGEVGSGRVEWLGSVSDHDAAALVQGAAVLAFPSLCEGFGLPAVEGMAAGVPVVASDIPVMREICGDAARLVDTTSPPALAEALVWAAEDRAARDLAAAGRARAARFTWRRCAEGTLAAYRALLERTS
jgi:glycosyltransferase involved in cell wall biosynthesis